MWFQVGIFDCFYGWVYINITSLSHLYLFVLWWWALRLLSNLGYCSVQLSHSVVSDSLRPNEWQHTRPPCPSPTPRVHPDSRVMPSSHLILGHPLLLLPPIPPSIRVFSNESTVCMRCPKYWSFSFSIIPSKEIPGLISFRMDSLPGRNYHEWV